MSSESPKPNKTLESSGSFRQPPPSKYKGVDPKYLPLFPSARIEAISEKHPLNEVVPTDNESAFNCFKLVLEAVWAEDYDDARSLLQDIAMLPKEMRDIPLDEIAHNELTEITNELHNTSGLTDDKQKTAIEITEIILAGELVQARVRIDALVPASESVSPNRGRKVREGHLSQSSSNSRLKASTVRHLDGTANKPRGYENYS